MTNKEISQVLQLYFFTPAMTFSQTKDTFMYGQQLYIDCYYNDDRMVIRDKTIQSHNQVIRDGTKPQTIDELKDILINSLINSLGLLRG